MSGVFSLNIAIRVDASLEIGIGHLMRCLTLADTFRKFGAYTKFVCRHIPTQLYGLLIKSGHDVSLLVREDTSVLESELEHAKWLGVNQEFDAIETLEALADSNWDWIIVDHYALDYSWEDIVKKSVTKMLVIDDLSNKQHTCDIFLNQNIVDNAESLYANKLPRNAIKLIGPQYALLREEFFVARSKATFRRGPIKNVLVSFGGADANNVTSKVLEALVSSKGLQLNVDVVIGTEHPYLNPIQNICKTAGYNCRIQINKMAELMLAADLAIGAAGSTSWERCYLALPSIIISIADNQIPIAQALDKIGASLYLGTELTVTAALISKTLYELYNDHERLFEISKKAYTIVDGKGKYQVFNSMCA